MDTKQDIINRIAFLKACIKQTEQHDGGNWNCYQDDAELYNLETLLEDWDTPCYQSAEDDEFDHWAQENPEVLRALLVLMED